MRGREKEMLVTSLDIYIYLQMRSGIGIVCEIGYLWMVFLNRFTFH